MKQAQRSEHTVEGNEDRDELDLSDPSRARKLHPEVQISCPKCDVRLSRNAFATAKSEFSSGVASSLMNATTNGHLDASLARPRGDSELWLPWEDGQRPFEEPGYLHVALSWVHAWDRQMRERILLEKQYLPHERDLFAQLSYTVAHNDWRGVVDWVSQLPLIGGRVDSMGTLHVSSENTMLSSLVSAVLSLLPVCAPFLRELLLGHVPSSH